MYYLQVCQVCGREYEWNTDKDYLDLDELTKCCTKPGEDEAPNG